MPPLEFPLLQFLELEEVSLQFPSWMIVPPRFKLFNKLLHFDLPQQPSELWVYYLMDWEAVSVKNPRLQVLRFEGTDPDYQDELLPLLQSRNKKIVDGFEIEGVRMERVKKLVIPLGEFGSKKLRRCQ